MRSLRIRLVLFAFCLASAFPPPGFAQAPEGGQSKNLAPGFKTLASGTKVAVMPIDIELFEISAGGVLEPKADWTESAAKNLRVALQNKNLSWGLEAAELSEADADETTELNSLHGAIARSISMHHFGALGLPTKEGRLDWSLGEPASAIKKITGADYALFSWVRDSYTSAERKAMIVAMAFLGVSVVGGTQIGYASLVDLNTGQIVWFNQLVYESGDLREPDGATATLDALLTEFPVSQ